jgi:hypothetical protein
MPHTDSSNLLETLIESTAHTLEIPCEMLRGYLLQHLGVDWATQIQLLHVAKKHALDPVAGEIQLSPFKHGWSVMITIDGWMKLINQHPHFQGMSLREPATEDSHAHVWMECCIYRDDRILPTVVKEYLSEVQTEHESWQQMPRRMLRHRVIQQCARLAFGIAAPEPMKAETAIGSNPDSFNATGATLNLAPSLAHTPRTAWLKQELSQTK